MVPKDPFQRWSCFVGIGVALVYMHRMGLARIVRY
jgi:hypothetical protein